MSIDSIRESINLILYKNKSVVLRYSMALKFFVSLAGLGAIIYYYGFPKDSYDQDQLFLIIKGSFLFFVLHFILRFIYDFQPLTFLKENWFEATLMFFLTIEGISNSLFDVLILEKLFHSLGFNFFADFSTIFVQIYFFGVMLTDLAKGSSIFPKIKMHPALIFILSFLVIIFSGTGLLMLPEMTIPVHSMNFLDALFSSTSATCVTGLMVEDTPNFFSFKGQVVLLILIKLGGLNIIAFGSFLALASKFGVGLKQHDVIEDFVNRDSFASAKGMLGKVFLWSICIELVGAFLMYISWGQHAEFVSNGDRAFSSLFHAVSAFNNAGISLFSDGLAHPSVAHNYFIHWIITILVFFGALGMVAIFDLFSFERLRKRLQNPWMEINFSTKIALYFSIILVVIGTVLYYFLEDHNTLEGYSFFGKITTATFQSVTRTSGFNSVNIGAIGLPMLFVLTILMFIGSSSSSTGGGIKTSTFAIIYADVIATIRGKKQPELFKRSISNLLKSRAYSVLLIFIIGNLVSIFLLSITEWRILAMENRTIMDLIFEQVSAMGTVGLSMGITADLSIMGKIIIIMSMLIGRVGTLTVAFAFTGNLISRNYKYPEGHTMVG